MALSDSSVAAPPVLSIVGLMVVSVLLLVGAFLVMTLLAGIASFAATYIHGQICFCVPSGKSAVALALSMRSNAPLL